MKTVEFIRMSLDMTAHVTLELIDDMKDAPLTFPTPKGGNHPLWVMGHLAWTEGQVMEVILGKPNPLAHWKSQFGFGSEPTPAASDYPTLAEARQAFLDLRTQTIKTLSSLTDADLDRPSEKCPPDAKEFVGTYGQCFHILIVNTMSHHGQVCDARRAAGRKPLSM